VVEQRSRQITRKTAAFHVISGSTVTPAMKITRMESEHLPIREILNGVKRYLTEGVPLDRMFA
jgi:hypothetical protein